MEELVDSLRIKSLVTGSSPVLATKTKNMRSIRELLELMLENQQIFNKDSGGLCSWVGDMRYANFLISYTEYITLRRYIESNRPNPYSSVGAFRARDTWFYWPKGNIKPRIKWLKEHINLNK